MIIARWPAMLVLPRLLVVVGMAIQVAGCATPTPGPGVADTTAPGAPNESASGRPAVAIPQVVAPEARALPARLDDVAIVGDSLTVGAEPYLPAEFAAVGSQVKYLKAQVGIPTGLGLADLAQHTADLPGTVILALGTNDVQASATDVVGWLEEARRIIGPNRRLVWVNLSMANPEYPNDEVVNEVLAQSAARDPRLAVLDWATFTADQRFSNAVDGVHYSDAGYRRRAWFYTCAVVDSRACRPYQLVRPAALGRSAPGPAMHVPADPVPASGVRPR